MEVKEGIVIDVKGNIFKKTLSDIQILIYKELYGKEWHMHVIYELEQHLDNLQITKSKNDQEEYEKEEEKRDARSTLLIAKESLKRKLKGQRVSHHERIYLYKQMKASEKPLAEIALENNLSLGTLYNIRKEFDTPIKGPELVKSTTARNLVESLKIKNIIKAYLDSTKTPWSSKDVWSYIKDKTGLVIHSRVVRRILTEELKMSYKKGKDRLVNFDENSIPKTNNGSQSDFAKQSIALKFWSMLMRPHSPGWPRRTSHGYLKEKSRLSRTFASEIHDL